MSMKIKTDLGHVSRPEGLGCRSGSGNDSDPVPDPQHCFINLQQDFVHKQLPLFVPRLS
jgi:hypothetical protein